MATWTDISASIIGVGKRIAYTLFDALKARDEALAEQPFQVDYSEQTTSSTTYVVSVTRRVWVPAAATKLRGTIELKTNNASHAATVKGTLGGTNDSDEPTSVSTTYEDKTITWASVTAFRGSARDIEIKLKIANGASVAATRCINRATFRWSYD